MESEQVKGDSTETDTHGSFLGKSLMVFIFEKRHTKKKKNASQVKRSTTRIIKHWEWIVVSFSATLEMNFCNDPQTLKRQIQSNNI